MNIKLKMNNLKLPQLFYEYILLYFNIYFVLNKNYFLQNLNFSQKFFLNILKLYDFLFISFRANILKNTEKYKKNVSAKDI